MYAFSFWSTFQSVFRNLLKTYTALYSLYMAVTPSPAPSPLALPRIKSNPIFRHVTSRSTKVLVKTCTCVQITKKMLKYTSNLYITSIKMLTINLQALHLIDYIQQTLRTSAKIFVHVLLKFSLLFLFSPLPTNPLQNLARIAGIWIYFHGSCMATYMLAHNALL